MTADTPAGVMADTAFMADLNAGDSEANARWYQAHQAADVGAGADRSGVRERRRTGR